MPRKSEFAGRYADALQVLEVATHRVAYVVNEGGHYALRVDFELGRYLSATNTTSAVGLGDQDADEPWRVQFFDVSDAETHMIADESAAWLIDAYDAACTTLPPTTPPNVGDLPPR